MKPVGLFLMFTFLTISLFAQNRNGSAEKKSGTVLQQKEEIKPAGLYFLEMEGIIYTGSSKAKVTITVYKDSSIFLTSESAKRTGKCEFALPFDQVYIVELSKEGYVSKRIKVNTKVPDLKKHKNLIFRFEADIFEAIPGLNVSILQKPVAEVKYSETFDGFIYDVDYTSKVNKELKKLYQDYYLLQKAMKVNDDGEKEQDK